VLSAVQELLARACSARDPVAALAALVDAAAPGALTPTEREQLRALDGDGLRLSARIVQELRLERTLRGNPRLVADYDADPAGFSSAFVAWCEQHPGGAVFPADEAAAWARRPDPGAHPGAP